MRSGTSRLSGVGAEFEVGAMGDNERVNSTARRGIASLAMCGLAAGIAWYAGSWFGWTTEDLKFWPLVLVAGIIVSSIMVVAVEAPLFRKRNLFFDAFEDKRPRWASLVVVILSVLFATHFATLLIQCRGGAWEVVNGEYILDSHGRTIGFLTQAQYMSLQSGELRTLATILMCSYFIEATYWWFPKLSNRTPS